MEIFKLLKKIRNFIDFTKNLNYILNKIRFERNKEVTLINHGCT